MTCAGVLDAEEAALEAFELAADEEAEEVLEAPDVAAVVVAGEVPVVEALALEVVAALLVLPPCLLVLLSSVEALEVFAVVPSEEVDSAALTLVTVPPVGFAGAEAAATFAAAFL